MEKLIHMDPIKSRNQRWNFSILHVCFKARILNDNQWSCTKKRVYFQVYNMYEVFDPRMYDDGKYQF